MHQGIKFLSPLNIFVILVPLFFLVILLSNPGFHDKLWPAAAYGMLTAAFVFLFGVLSIIWKILHISKLDTKIYFAAGLMNLCFGLAFIISLVLTSGEIRFQNLWIPMLPVFIGIFILIHAITEEKIQQEKNQQG